MRIRPEKPNDPPAPFDRRQFLSLTAAVGAASLAPFGANAQEAPATPMPAPAEGGSEELWAWVRRQFLIAPDVIDLSAMLLASHPAPVRTAIERHRHALDVNPVPYIEDNNDDLQNAGREAAGAYLGVHSSHVALTDSTTMGAGLVYNGLILKPGDEILTTDRDYYVTHESIRLAAERSGATVRKLKLFEDIAAVSAGQLADTIMAAIGQHTRVLALTWVHSSTGLKLPIAAIGARLADLNQSRPAERKILFCVDGVHGFGIEDFRFDDLGADFFFAGCHKWLFGPRGTGIVVASRNGLNTIRATIPSFVSERSFSAWVANREPTGAIDADTITPGGFKAFEHLWSLPEAFALHRDIGKDRIAARTHALATQLKQGIAGAPGISLRTPPDPNLSAGIVSFDVAGWSPWNVVRRLRQDRIIASVAPYAAQHVRLTPSIRNSPEEIDVAITALRSLA